MHKYVVTVVCLVILLVACSSPPSQQSYLQNGIVMTPELQALEARLKGELEQIVEERRQRRELVLETLGLPEDASLCDLGPRPSDTGPEAGPPEPEPTACDPDLLPNVESHIIDTDSGYAYSLDIGLYRPNVYSRGEDGVYRNDLGEPLSIGLSLINRDQAASSTR
jgi:hypothetical protein